MAKLNRRDVSYRLVKRYSNGGNNGEYKKMDSYKKLTPANIPDEKTYKSQMLDKLKRGIAQVESLGGILMINPESTATGKYGQRFSEIKEMNLPGPTRMSRLTREAFAKDIGLQESLFEKRFEGTLKKDVPGLYRNAKELSKEYKSVIEDLYTEDEVAALSHFLGRQGAREYFGNVLRDGKSLEEVFPTKYGPKKEQSNKTPEEYIREYRRALKNN
jgi:hypothetical protein